MKTYIPKVDSLQKRWYVVDASGKTLGRLATQIAKIIRGKNKPIYTPHLDTGDYVIVVNAEKVALTGRKWDKKEYRWYTGYPGGLKSLTYRQLLARHPERIIEHAVRGMLPKNRLGRKLARHLFVYTGKKHPHQAQKPEKIDI
ncbi:50S ribosomal protein L13 [bacterium]|nr:MAG: 50S ribosomal protein L13 [bacterium]